MREIRIVDQIDPNLDTRSFQLATLRLGDYTVALPQARGAFSGEFDLTKTLGYVLQVTAGMDINTGIAHLGFAGHRRRYGHRDRFARRWSA